VGIERALRNWGNDTWCIVGGESARGHKCRKIRRLVEKDRRDRNIIKFMALPFNIFTIDLRLMSRIRRAGRSVCPHADSNQFLLWTPTCGGSQKGTDESGV